MWETPGEEFVKNRGGGGRGCGEDSGPDPKPGACTGRAGWASGPRGSGRAPAPLRPSAAPSWGSRSHGKGAGRGQGQPGAAVPQARSWPSRRGAPRGLPRDLGTAAGPARSAAGGAHRHRACPPRNLRLTQRGRSKRPPRDVVRPETAPLRGRGVRSRVSEDGKPRAAVCPVTAEVDGDIRPAPGLVRIRRNRRRRGRRAGPRERGGRRAGGGPVPGLPAPRIWTGPRSATPRAWPKARRASAWTDVGGSSIL